MSTLRVFERDDATGMDRIVMGEILIPDTPNVFGDFHTRRSVQEFAYGFMANGFGVNVEHDNPDVSERVTVVESFIAREGDKDFIPGSWVVGVWVEDDHVWHQVLRGDINGFSYEAMVKFFELDLLVPNETTRYGRSEPSIEDGHEHDYFVLLDDDGRVITGGTTFDDGHAHRISSHTFTERALGHQHIYNLVVEGM